MLFDVGIRFFCNLTPDSSIRDKHLAWLRAFAGADEATAFEDVHHAGGAGVAEAQATLEQGGVRSWNVSLAGNSCIIGIKINFGLDDVKLIDGVKRGRILLAGKLIVHRVILGGGIENSRPNHFRDDGGRDG